VSVALLQKIRFLGFDRTHRVPPLLLLKPVFPGAIVMLFCLLPGIDRLAEVRPGVDDRQRPFAKGKGVPAREARRNREETCRTDVQSRTPRSECCDISRLPGIRCAAVSARVRLQQARVFAFTCEQLTHILIEKGMRSVPSINKRWLLLKQRRDLTEMTKLSGCFKQAC